MSRPGGVPLALIGLAYFVSLAFGELFALRELLKEGRPAACIRRLKEDKAAAETIGVFTVPTVILVRPAEPSVWLRESPDHLLRRVAEEGW